MCWPTMVRQLLDDDRVRLEVGGGASRPGAAVRRREDRRRLLGTPGSSLALFAAWQSLGESNPKTPGWSLACPGGTALAMTDSEPVVRLRGVEQRFSGGVTAR